MFVCLGNHCLARLQLLRFVRQLALLGGQRLRLLGLRCLAPLRLGLRPLRQLGFQTPPQRRQLARLGLHTFPALGLLRQLGPRLCQRLGQPLQPLLEGAAVLLHPGHRRLACLPCLRLIRQLGLLGGQCQ